MKHSDLKVGMKVKRVSYFNKHFYASTEGNISTVEYIDNNCSTFCVEEEKDCYFEAQYFEPVEEIKEKKTMNTKSNLISMDKKYKTRCGYPVRILCVDRKDDRPVLFLYTINDSEIACRASSTGKVDWTDTDYDLVEVSPYEDFKKDDKVMVSEDGIIWYKRYFSHATVKGAYVFDNGNTSWTEPNGDTTNWLYCRKPTQEELGD